ncbi:MAG: IS66 family transposase [Blastocatellia bacterium]
MSRLRKCIKPATRRLSMSVGKQIKTVFHKPTRDLANEMLNDWEAIFRVLQHPELPLTNNEAERALRHGRSFCAKSPMARVPKKVHESSPY